MGRLLAPLVLFALLGCAGGGVSGGPETETGPDSGQEEGAPTADCVVYRDADADGYGDDTTATTATACEVPDGYTSVGGDCDDGAATVHPDAYEPCDGVDNDCDGALDEGGTVGPYRDGDGDGYGAGEAVEACDGVGTYVRNHADCDDGDPNISPGAEEILGNGLDENCNGADGLIPLGTDTSGFAVCATIAYDTDGDGEVDALAFEALDAHDNLRLWVADRGANDSIEVVYQFTYDTNDLLVTEEHDLDGDFSTDYQYTSTYDGDNRLVLYEADTSADGSVDGWISYTYDAAGDLELIYAEGWGAPYEIQYSYDGDHHNLSWTCDQHVDGDIEEEWTGIWSEEGTLSSASFDSYWDLASDWECDYEWTDSGLMSESRCTGESYVEASVDQWEYDDADRMTVHEQRGEDDLRWTYTYDAAGALVLEEVDVDIDGVVDTFLTYSRDADGRLLEEIYSGADGTVYHQTVYSYGCYGEMSG